MLILMKKFVAAFLCLLVLCLPALAGAMSYEEEREGSSEVGSILDAHGLIVGGQAITWPGEVIAAWLSARI